MAAITSATRPAAAAKPTVDHLTRKALVSAICKDVPIPATLADRVLTSLALTTYAAVKRGQRVTLTGFGTWERRTRKARTARNPRTGEPIKVKKANVPAFKPGTTFKQVVAGGRKLPMPAWKTSSASSRGSGVGTAAARTQRAAASASASTRSSASQGRGSAASRPSRRRSAAKPSPAASPSKPRRGSSSSSGGGGGGRGRAPRKS